MSIQNNVRSAFIIAATLCLPYSYAVAQMSQPVVVEQICGPTNISACDQAVNAAKTPYQKYGAYYARTQANLDAEKYAAVIPDIDTLLTIVESLPIPNGKTPEEWEKEKIKIQGELYVMRAGSFAYLEDYMHAKEDIVFSLIVDPELLSHSDSAIFYHVRGQIYQGLKQNDEAIADYKRVVATMAGSPPDDPNISLLRNSYIQLGEIALQEGQYQISVDNFTNVIAMDPQTTTYYLKRGFGYYNMDKYPDALKDFDTYLQANGGDLSARMMRAECHIYLDNFDKSIADLNIVVADPLADVNKKAVSYLLLGEAYEGKKDPSNAMKNYTQSITLRPDRDEDAYVNRSKLYADLGNFEAAIADVDQAIIQDPATPGLYLIRATIHAEAAVRSSAFVLNSVNTEAYAVSAKSDVDKFLKMISGPPNPPALKKVNEILAAITPLLPSGRPSPDLPGVKPVEPFKSQIPLPPSGLPVPDLPVLKPVLPFKSHNFSEPNN
jgi:tetratricopeptide (TPR) repeat protein